MAKAVDELAARTPGALRMAMEGFAKALRQIPTIICENAGLDSSEIVSRLRAAHAEGKTTMGVERADRGDRGHGDPGVTECFRVKQQILLSGTERRR